MVHKLIFRILYAMPLRRCECGGKAELRMLDGIKGRYCFIGCDRYACPRMVSKIYKHPIVAILKWNIKDWKYSKENNTYLKQMKGER